MSRKRPTVADIRAMKGKRQLTMLREGAEYWRSQGHADNAAALEREAAFVEKLVVELSRSSERVTDGDRGPCGGS